VRRRGAGHLAWLRRRDAGTRAQLQTHVAGAAANLAVARRGGVQGAHDMPQLAGDLLSTHWPLQTWKPPSHVRLHACADVQVPVPCAGAPQSVLVRQPPVGTQVASGQAL